MSDLQNQDSKPGLEENDFIEVFKLNSTNCEDKCRKLEKEGYVNDARVRFIAKEMEIARQ